MSEIKTKYYATAVLLALIVFSSNFLNAGIFEEGYQNFSVWFILSLFAFACGWLIDKTLHWNRGGKVVFAVIVATTFISIILAILFSNYFGLTDLVLENIVLYVLRNITIGTMAFFGMAVAELLLVQRENEALKQKSVDIEKKIIEAEKEANFIVEEAKLTADKILTDAKKSANEMIDTRDKIRQQLKEFITTEKELVNQYKKEDNS